MARLPADASDQIVWICNDAANSTILNNVGSAGNAGDLTKNLNPVLEGEAFFANGLWLLGSTTVRDYFAGANTVQPALFSMSFWVYLRSYSIGASSFVRKSYRNDNTWFK